MRIVTIANQKGGVGKTALTVNLAAALGRRGLKVLIVDMDSQANATLSTVGVPEDEEDAPRRRSLAHVLASKIRASDPGAAIVRIQDILLPTPLGGVTIAPSSEDMCRADLMLNSATGREHILSRALAELTEPFDLVLIDTSPYLGLITVNALVAADHVLVPVAIEYLPLYGLKLLSKTIEELRATIPGAHATILGYVPTLFDRRYATSEQLLAKVESRFPGMVFQAKLRTNSNFKVLPAHRLDVFTYEEKETKAPRKGVEDFNAIADEFLHRLNLTTAGAVNAA